MTANLYTLYYTASRTDHGWWWHGGGCEPSPSRHSLYGAAYTYISIYIHIMCLLRYYYYTEREALAARQNQAFRVHSRPNVL